MTASPGVQTRAAAAAAAAAQLLAQRLNDNAGLSGAARRQTDRFDGPSQDGASRAPRKQLPTLWLERQAKEQQFKQVGIQIGTAVWTAARLCSCLVVDRSFGLSHAISRCCAHRSTCVVC